MEQNKASWNRVKESYADTAKKAVGFEIEDQEMVFS